MQAASAAGVRRTRAEQAVLMQEQTRHGHGSTTRQSGESAKSAPVIPGTGGTATKPDTFKSDTNGHPMINTQPGDPGTVTGYGYQSPEHDPDNFADPLPGQSTEGIEVKSRSDVGGNLQHTLNYANMHAYDEDLRSLAKEIDRWEPLATTMSGEVVKKENYVAGLQKRIRFLMRDMQEQKGTLGATVEHINALEARIQRLAMQRQQSEIVAQKHQFDIASQKLRQEVNSVEQVSDAIGSRIKRLGAGIASSRNDEIESMRLSLQPSVAAGHEQDERAELAVADSSA